MTAVLTESAAFHAYHARPTPDTLIDLLRAYQARIFRLCYQVLRNVQDAEDAAQEVLLKIPAEAGKFGDPDSFRPWLHRVSLNQALEGARKAARRRVHETRAAMQDSAPKPLEDATRLALFEALAGLDDASRNLLLEHYFEGEPIGSIARRRACSPSTACDRLEGARESLRRRLGGAGAMAALPNLEALFPAAPAVPDLVTGAVLAHAKTVAATLAVGGSIVAAKSSVIGVTVVVALACFVAGTGTGVFFKGRDGRDKVADLERRLAAAESRPAIASALNSVPLSTVKAPSSNLPETAVASPKEAVNSKLKEKLARYRFWIEAYYKEYDEVSKRDPGNIEAYRARKNAELGELLVGIKDLTCVAPQEFLEFLRDAKNETYLSSLILRGLGFVMNEPMHHGQEFKAFPRELHDGMLDLLMTGSLPQKRATLQYFALIWNQPAEFKSAYPQFLNEPDPSFQVQVVWTIAQSNSWTDEAFAAVARLGSSTDNSDVRSAIGNAMMWSRAPEAFSYLIDRLEATGDTQEVISVGQTLSTKISNTYQQKRPPAEIEDRIVRAVTSAMGRGFDGATFLVVVRAALALPAEKLKPILQQALSQAPTDHSRKTVEELIRLVNLGQATPEELRKASWGEN